MPTIKYPQNSNSDTVFVEENGTKTRAVKTVQLDGTVDYPKNSNSENCYVTVDGKKQRALMVADISSGATIDYPNNPNSTKGYVTVNGKKQRVVFTATLSGGGGGGATIEELNVTPSTSAQTITASGGVDGYSPVNVSAVTSSIDANITAGNIKKDVQILGVTGTYTGGAPALYREFQLDANGVLQPNTTTTHIMDFTGMTGVSDYALYYAYNGNAAISGLVDMSDLITLVGTSACYYMFHNCTGITGADLSALTTISGANACNSMFSGCTGLTSMDLSALTTISGTSACNTMFAYTGITSANLSALTTISGISACQGMFVGCGSLATVYIGGTTAIDFGTRTNQFLNLFIGCTQNIDVYAPAANQAQIEAFSGYPNFGGTGTVTWHWRS